MKKGDKIGIVCCSNGQKQENKNTILQLEDTLRGIGLTPVQSSMIYEKDNVFSGTAKERAEALMKFYEDPEIKGIFDISGGDIANGILPYLDYEVIAKSQKQFWGYSDLTTVLNAIYTKTGEASVLYQIRNLVYDHGEAQTAAFENTVLKGAEDLYQIAYHFVQQTQMQGIVIGGNIRCFLKLAGTEYMPDFKDKILLLESYGGRPAQMETYLSCLEQLGAFEQINGILLGTFTQMEQERCTPDIVTLLKTKISSSLPVAVTGEIGHGTDARGIQIGKRYYF